MYKRAAGWIQSYLNKTEGVTAIEYALIAALIAVVIITAVTLAGEQLQATFDTIAGAVQNAGSS